jgi:hypothetical protein
LQKIAPWSPNNVQALSGKAVVLNLIHDYLQLQCDSGGSEIEGGVYNSGKQNFSDLTNKHEILETSDQIQTNSKKIKKFGMILFETIFIASYITIAYNNKEIMQHIARYCTYSKQHDLSKFYTGMTSEQSWANLVRELGHF